MSKKIALLLLFFVSVSQAQNKEVRVYTERNSQNGDITIFAENKTKSDYTVLVKFAEIKNVQHGISKTLTLLVNPGTVTLIKLVRDNTNNKSIQLNYSYTYIKGCLNSKHNNDITYLIPTTENKEVKIRYVKHFSSSSGKTLPDSFNVYSFKMQKGDTVFAARRGVVSKIIKSKSIEQGNSSFHANRHIVEIMQKDCTYANYKYFDNLFVIEGESILAGQPIGTVRINNGTNDYTLIFKVEQFNINTTGSKLVSNIETLTLNFDVNGISQNLIENNLYTPTFSFKTITQEMRKREIKKYKKSKSI